MANDIQTTQADDWRPRVMVLGGVIGAVVGVLSAFLYIRSAEEAGTGIQPEPPEASDAVKLGISLMGIVRTVTEWAKK